MTHHIKYDFSTGIVLTKQILFMKYIPNYSKAFICDHHSIHDKVYAFPFTVVPLYEPFPAKAVTEKTIIKQVNITIASVFFMFLPSKYN